MPLVPPSSWRPPGDCIVTSQLGSKATLRRTKDGRVTLARVEDLESVVHMKAVANAIVRSALRTDVKVRIDTMLETKMRLSSRRVVGGNGGEQGASLSRQQSPEKCLP